MKERYGNLLNPEELAARQDPEIDHGEIPELNELFWARAKVNPPCSKANVRTRVLPDVFEIFRSEIPNGHTGRMAAVLTACVQALQSK